MMAGIALAMLAASPQQTPQKAPPPPAGVDALPDDIVVEGQRDLPADTVTSTRPTLSAPDPTQSAVANRVKYEFSERIAGCAVRGQTTSLRRLREVIDAAPNESSQVLAQDRLKRSNVPCSEGLELLKFAIPNLGYSIYDRGALTIASIRRFAPDLVLTSAITGDPAVQARFNAREVPRNRFRLPADYRYFEVAVCMVRVQPRLSVRLTATDPDPKQQTRIAARIVDNAKLCVGDAKRVYFDPTQFRMFIADAVYRWAVAARGVDSLIPAVAD